MMSAAQPFPILTSAEYFAWEEKQSQKHEYIDGQIYAMSGGSVNHGRIGIRLTTLLETRLQDGACLPGNSDVKIRIPNSQNYTYPDASVTCDPRDRETPDYFSYPCLIIEVLSPSTEAYDRGGKFRLYRQNPALKDYLLVSSTSIEADLYSQDDLGQWRLLSYQSGDIITLPSLNLRFSLDDLYQGLTLANRHDP
ncbi:MAG: Uma2 family endonuclease [Cyanobacteria bacterium RI_101]|nr:Uma2 family endonuclease [Cyanobacteria bacterium RI_101]